MKVKLSTEKAIETGYALADFVGDMSLAYGPVVVFTITAMGYVSIALKGTLATNNVFTLGWAIATAIVVDGLWLGVWLRVRSFKFTVQATWYHNLFMGLRYSSMLVIALLMFAVAVCMSILITYQQVKGVANEFTAMQALYIDPLAFIVARGFLVMLCATVGIFFRAEKAETIATQKKARSTQPKPVQSTVHVQESTESTDTIAIPESAESMQDTSRSLQYIMIKRVMSNATVDGTLTMTLQAIADNAGVGLSTVKKHNKKIKKELGIE